MTYDQNMTVEERITRIEEVLLKVRSELMTLGSMRYIQDGKTYEINRAVSRITEALDPFFEK